MTNHLVGSEPKRILAQVHEGMDVFNSHDEKIGTVEAVYLGTASEEEAATGTGAATADDPTTSRDSFVEIVAEIFDPEELPAEMAERLRYNGFVRVDVVGFFGRDRFVTPDAIDHVSDAGIRLKLPEAPRITN